MYCFVTSLPYLRPWRHGCQRSIKLVSGIAISAEFIQAGQVKASGELPGQIGQKSSRGLAREAGQPRGSIAADIFAFVTQGRHCSSHQCLSRCQIVRDADLPDFVATEVVG